MFVNMTSLAVLAVLALLGVSFDQVSAATSLRGGDSGGNDDGWSEPLVGASYHEGPAYVAANTCTYCTQGGEIPSGEALDNCCPEGGCGQCTNDWWSGKAHIGPFIDGLEQICQPSFPIDDISVGHGMYDGQLCGECVCIRCDPQSDQGCQSEEPFLHMRQDDPYGSSNEVSAKYMKLGSPDARWYTNGQQDISWYRYKKVDRCDPSLCM